MNNRIIGIQSILFSFTYEHAWGFCFLFYFCSFFGELLSIFSCLSVFYLSDGVSPYSSPYEVHVGWVTYFNFYLVYLSDVYLSLWI